MCAARGRRVGYTSRLSFPWKREEPRGDENVSGWTSGRKAGAISTMYFSFPLAYGRAFSPRPARSMIYRDHAAARGRILYRDKLAGLREGYADEIKSGLAVRSVGPIKPAAECSPGAYVCALAHIAETHECASHEFARYITSATRDDGLFVALNYKFGQTIAAIKSTGDYVALTVPRQKFISRFNRARRRVYTGMSRIYRVSLRL